MTEPEHPWVSQLTHHTHCSGTRQPDVTEHPAEGITTLHCVECAAHAAYTADGTALPEPERTGPWPQEPPLIFEAEMTPAPHTRTVYSQSLRKR